MRHLHHARCIAGGKFRHLPHAVIMVRRVQHITYSTLLRAVAQQRLGMPRVRDRLHQRRAQCGKHILARKVQPARIDAVPAEQIRRQVDLVMRRADHRHGAHHVNRIRDQFLDGDIGVRDAVDEGRVRPVLQEPPHEVGQQRLVCAHRRIDAAGPVQLVGADDLVIERFAHAMQALELIVAHGEARPGQGVDSSKRLRIVRGELREQVFARVEQLARTGEVAHIRVYLAREHGESVESVHLRALDLGIPIGALDESHHDAPARAPGKVHHEVDHEGTALAIGLDHEAEAIPFGQFRVEAQRLQQVERQFEAVRLFRIDVEADVVMLGELRQRLHVGQQLLHHPLGLGARIARVECRELDRDARAFIHAPARRRLADGVDRILVVTVIARSIGGCRRCLAQHVIGIAEAPRLERLRALQRFGDRLARHELLAHHAHRHVDAAADHGLARPRDEA